MSDAPPSWLSQVTSLQGALESRPQNNFGIARLLAALIVVIAHSYPISASIPSAFGKAVLYVPYPYVGNYPVAIFFVISGFLVTQSFLSGRRSTARFVTARLLRLYPALVAGVVLSLVLGTLSNALPLSDTIASASTWSYLWQNATGFQFVPELPGAFPGNPIPGGPNGSLWSLPVEARLYIWVGLLGSAGLLAHRRGGIALLLVTIALLFAVRTPPEWLWHETHSIFAIEFMFGMLAFLVRDHVRLSIPLALALGLVFLATALLSGPGPASEVFALCLPYWLFVAACHPALPVVRLPGDYSYGIYVYSFPIQQTIAWLLPDIEPWAFIALTLALVGSVAVASWHLLERRFLALKPAP